MYKIYRKFLNSDEGDFEIFVNSGTINLPVACQVFV